MSLHEPTVVILAGGKGTRLHPLTLSIPKPLLPLGQTPILDIVLQQLSGVGLTRVLIAVGYLGAMIEDHVGDGAKFGLHVDYLREDWPRGTAGAIALAPATEGPMIVLNGDLLTKIDFSEVLTEHVTSGSDATIVCVRRANTVDFGVLHISESGVLVRYEEKPTSEYLVSCGIYILNPSVTSLIASETALDMPDLMALALARGLVVRCTVTSEYWQDIGRVDDYRKASEDFVTDPDAFL